jgi:hypothetical protein
MKKKPARKLVFSTLDPQKRTVYFYDDTWEHIKKEHPEVRGGSTRHRDVKGIRTIRSTVEDPLTITHDQTRNALSYADYTTSGLYFKVIAKIDDKANVCTVSTAYLTPDQPKGSVIWQQNKAKRRKS